MPSQLNVNVCIIEMVKKHFGSFWFIQINSYYTDFNHSHQSLQVNVGALASNMTWLALYVLIQHYLTQRTAASSQNIKTSLLGCTAVWTAS